MRVHLRLEKTSQLNRQSKRQERSTCPSILGKPSDLPGRVSYSVGSSCPQQEVQSGATEHFHKQNSETKQRDELGKVCQADPQGSHSCKVATEARTNLKISSLIHPSSSPDLNPIEDGWNLLKTKISLPLTQATNLDILWEQTQACWVNIDQQLINRLIEERPDRMEGVCMSKGKMNQFRTLGLLGYVLRTMTTKCDH